MLDRTMINAHFLDELFEQSSMTALGVSYSGRTVSSEPYWLLK